MRSSRSGLQVIQTVSNVGSKIECGGHCAPSEPCNAFALDAATSDCHLMDREMKHGTVIASPAEKAARTYVQTGKERVQPSRLFMGNSMIFGEFTMGFTFTRE